MTNTTHTTSIGNSISLSDNVTMYFSEVNLDIGLSEDVVSKIVKSVYGLSNKKDKQFNTRLETIVSCLYSELTTIRSALTSVSSVIPMLGGQINTYPVSFPLSLYKTEQEVIDDLTGESSEMCLVKLFIQSMTRDIRDINVYSNTVRYFIDHRCACSLPEDVSVDQLWKSLLYNFNQKELGLLNISSDPEESNTIDFFQEKNGSGELFFTIKTKVGLELNNVKITDNFKQFGNLYTRIYNKLLDEIKTNLGININDYDGVDSNQDSGSVSVKERFFAVATHFINESRKQFDTDPDLNAYKYYTDFKARTEHYSRESSIKLKIACTKEGSGDFIVVKGNDVYELKFTPSLTQEDSYIFTYTDKTNYYLPESRFKIFVLKMINQIETFKDKLD